MPDYPGFLGGDVTAQSSIASGEVLTNFYLERSESGNASTPLAAYPTPGVRAIASATQSPGRGHFSHRGRDFCVIGSQFLEATLSGLTVIGSVAVDQYPATLCTNGDYGDQILISSGNNGYVYTLTTSTLTQVRTGGTRMVAHLDGYGLALDADTSTLYVSDNGDFTVWDPTQFLQRSDAPDPWVALKVPAGSKYAYLLGSETSSALYDAGTSPFPLAPHAAGLLQQGCAAPFSASDVGGVLYWLAQTKDGAGQIVSTAGFDTQVVSSFAVSVSIGALDTISDAIGDGYQELGHTFYLLTFPTGRVTWAYDATEALNLPPAMRWARRMTWNATTSEEDAWRPLFHTYCFGVHLTLDRAGGTLYQLSSDYGTDVDSRPIRRVRRPPSLYSDHALITVPCFELLLETGVALASGQGSDPQVSLRISRDGGKTWGPERTRSAGARGQYDVRLRWWRNGSARRWQPEIIVSDPIPFRLLGAIVELGRNVAAA